MSKFAIGKAWMLNSGINNGGINQIQTGRVGGFVSYALVYPCAVPLRPASE